jgi:hypothetical protein
MITLAAADTLAGGASVASQLTSTIFGMELASGVQTYKVLDQRQLAAAPATVYTVPVSTTAFVKAIMVVNNDTVSRTFQFFRGGTAAANAITPVFTLLPSGCAVYEDGFGWQLFNSSGQLLIGTGQVPLGPWHNYAPTGHLAESIPRSICVEANSIIPTASGTMFMQAIYLEAGITVSNISWHSATTAAGTPTNNILGLYSLARAKLAETANQTTAAWAAQTMKTIAVGTPYLVPTSGIYYIAFMMTATTIITSKGNTAKTNGALAAQAPILHGISDTGLTTSIPANAAAITSGLVNAWCAVS